VISGGCGALFDSLASRLRCSSLRSDVCDDKLGDGASYLCVCWVMSGSEGGETRALSTIRAANFLPDNPESESKADTGGGYIAFTS
jgi:hypothetical protein